MSYDKSVKIRIQGKKQLPSCTMFNFINRCIIGKNPTPFQVTKMKFVKILHSVPPPPTPPHLFIVGFEFFKKSFKGEGYQDFLGEMGGVSP